MFRSSVDKRGVWRLLMAAVYSGTRNPVELEFSFFPSFSICSIVKYPLAHTVCTVSLDKKNTMQKACSNGGLYSVVPWIRVLQQTRSKWNRTSEKCRGLNKELSPSASSTINESSHVTAILYLILKPFPKSVLIGRLHADSTTA